MKNKAIIDSETYLKNVLKIPFVNLPDIDLEIIKEFIRVFEQMLNAYPKIKDSICAIGLPEDMNNQVNLTIYSNQSTFVDDFNSNGWISVNKDRGFMCTTSVFNNSAHAVYLGLSLNSNLKGMTLESINTYMVDAASEGIYPKHCDKFKSFVLHEFGHVLDEVLNIRNNLEFLDLIKEADIKKEVSDYATTSTPEIIAEAFAEYHSNPNPTGLIKQIGELIDEKYYERANKNSSIFDIRRKYYK